MEISEEFRPITPVKVVSTAARSTCSSGKKLLDLGNLTEVARWDDCYDEDEERRTPRSPAADDILKQPVVCPLAPKKYRPVKRKFSPSSQEFFQVPKNLESIFLPISKPSSKKIRAS